MNLKYYTQATKDGIKIEILAKEGVLPGVVSNEHGRDVRIVWNQEVTEPEAN